MAKMNASQNDFAKSAIDQDFALLDDFIHWPAEHVRPDFRDDAVAATKKAAILHFDVSPVAVVKSRDPVGNIDDSESTKQIRQFAFVGDDLGDAWQSGDGFGFAGRVATHYNNPCVRVVAVHAADDLPTLGVAFASDRAGVDDAEVGRLFLFGVSVADPE